jgi:hypothetical protein
MYILEEITSLKSGTETQFDCTCIVHCYHKQLSAFVTVTTGETSRTERCCGRTDRMETINICLILLRESTGKRVSEF